MSLFANIDALMATVQSRFGQLALDAMRVEDLDEVMPIENAIYAHPWTRGNFLDSLRTGDQTLTIRNEAGRLLAYVVVMEALDEAHLLNISVAQELHGAGLGYLLLALVVQMARQHLMKIMLLEVRVSNAPALRLYQQYGFVEIGRRKNYYPVDLTTREDAIVMQLSL